MCVSSNDAINLKQTWGTLTGDVTARERCAAQCRFREGFAAGDPPKAVIQLRFTRLAPSGSLSRGQGDSAGVQFPEGRPGEAPTGRDPGEVQFPECRPGEAPADRTPRPAAAPSAALALMPRRASAGKAVRFASPESFLNILK